MEGALVRAVFWIADFSLYPHMVNGTRELIRVFISFIISEPKGPLSH